MALDERLIEKLETLDGTRARAKGQSAVRIDDMAALLQLPAQLRSAKAVGAAPTKAEHDALVADIQLIHARLQEIAAALQTKVLP